MGASPGEAGWGAAQPQASWAVCGSWLFAGGGQSGEGGVEAGGHLQVVVGGQGAL